MNSHNSNKHEYGMLDQHNTGIGGDEDVTDGGENNIYTYPAPENKVIQCKQKSGSGEIRVRSGCKNQRPERLGIEQ